MSNDITNQLLDLVKQRQEAQKKAEEEQQKLLDSMLEKHGKKKWDPDSGNITGAGGAALCVDDILIDTIQETREMLAKFYDPPADETQVETDEPVNATSAKASELEDKQ